MTKNKIILDLIINIIVGGVGLAVGGPIPGSALSQGLVINWTSSLAWTGWEAFRDTWIKQAPTTLAQALSQAIKEELNLADLIFDFQNDPCYQSLSSAEQKESGKFLRYLKTELKNLSTQTTWSEINLTTLALSEADFPINKVQDIESIIKSKLNTYLTNRDLTPSLITFLQNRLNITHISQTFIKHLKNNTTLWREQQLLFAQTYLAKFQNLQQNQAYLLAGQESIISQLQSIVTQLQALITTNQPPTNTIKAKKIKAKNVVSGIQIKNASTSQIQAVLETNKNQPNSHIEVSEDIEADNIVSGTQITNNQ